MERRQRRRQDEPPAQIETPWGTVAALALLVLGMAGYLSLISYDPRDVRSDWMFCQSMAVTDRPNEPAANIIGPMGAYGAACTYLMFGVAAYLLPTAMVWFGVSMLVSRERPTARAIAGLALVMTCAPAALAVQRSFFTDWARDHRILDGNPGGGLGCILGERLVQEFVGSWPALFLFAVGYISGLVMITGLHPLHFLQMCRDGVESLVEQWRASRLPRPVLAAAGAGALSRTAPSLVAGDATKPVRRGRKSAAPLIDDPDAPGAGRSPLDIDDELIIPGDEVAAKLGLGRPAPIEVPVGKDGTVQMEFPLPAKPEPKIIDSSERKPPAEDRPSLADIRRKAKEQKPAGAIGASLGGDFSKYELPDFDLLQVDESFQQKPADKGALLGTQQTIIRTLGTFGINVTPGDITRGPTITRYEIYPEEGLRVNRITALEADLARATKAERINILAPIPGKDTVGIEIANHDKVPVPLRELLEDATFATTKAKLPLALGKDVYGNVIVGDLAAMPHLLVAGATGSGKSVCINSIIASLLFQFTPDQLRFIMVDPKVVEMQQYNEMPHLVIPVVTDPKKTVAALNWVVNEMEARYRVFAECGVRNFESFNKRPRPEKAPKPAPAAPADAETEPDDVPALAANAIARKRAPKAVVSDPDEDVVAKLDLPPVSDEELVDTDNPSADMQRTPPLSELAASAFHAHEVRISDNDEAGDLSISLDGPVEEQDDAASDEPVAPAGETVWSKEDDFYADEDDEDNRIPDRYPYIVVIIDELADLMQTAPADIEIAICRIAQKARAAGIHLILATQTPRADVITGVIKANIPSKIAFQVSNALDSRVILDTKGAEKLVGKGDMLYLPPGSAKLMRAQGAFVTDDEVNRIVDFCKKQAKPSYVQSVRNAVDGGGDGADGEEVTEEDEECYEKCLEVISQEKRASTSLLQRRLRLGYTRAARMMDILEMRGIIGPGEGAKPREILVDLGDLGDDE